MLLNLRKIGAGAPYEEKTFDFSHSLDLSSVKFWGERPFSKPVEVNGTAGCRSGIYTVRYAAELETTGTCSRCLVPVTQAISREYEHTVLVDPEDDDIADDFILAEGGELDLDELVISDLLLDFGGVTLCKEDCRGLCPKCGKNLNEGGCGCVLTEPDTRFGVLRQFLDNE